MQHLDTRKIPLLIWLICLVGLVASLLIPWFSLKPGAEPQRRVITVHASRYGYTPGRIEVNQGDTVVLRATSDDVTHGFSLDGYPVDLRIKQQGVLFQKYQWEDDDGSIVEDWDRVSEVEFVATKSGKYVFRCTMVCGSLHPFMTGELVVRPNTYYGWAGALSLWVFGSVLLLGWRFFPVSSEAQKENTEKSINLTQKSRLLKFLLTRRTFQFFLLAPMVVIFYLFIISALFGTPVGNRNITIIVVWIFWWFLLKAVFVPLGGRFWCTICPLPAPAEWLSRKTFIGVNSCDPPIRGLRHKFLGRQLDWPKPLRNMWLQNIIFLAMISFGIMLITRPVATGLVFILILLGTLLLALFFRGRVFCRYICPVSGFLSTYSMASMTMVRAIDPQVCKNHRQKSCLQGNERGWACPWGQYLGKMDRNSHCGLCGECFKSCPKDNVGLFLRPFNRGGELKGFDELVNVSIMVVVAVAFSMTMLGPWGGIRDSANLSETGNYRDFFIYIGAIWSCGLLIFPAFFLGLNWLSGIFFGRTLTVKKLSLATGSMFIPLGIFAWIAFSLPSVLLNYGYIFNVLSDPLGLGWDVFGWSFRHFPPLWPDWIPLIQGALLLLGLYTGLHRGLRSLVRLTDEPVLAAKLLVIPAILPLIAVNLLLRLYLG